jgi:hypothetical protein
VWGSISKSRGSIHHKVDKDSSSSPRQQHLSPVSAQGRPSSAGSLDRRPSSPMTGAGAPARPTTPGGGGRPTTPVGARRLTSSGRSPEDGLLYGELVAKFNQLQKGMTQLKSEVLREFKGEMGCEIVNLLLIGGKRTHMYLCIGGKWYSVPTATSIAGHCALSGETLNIPEVHADDRFNIDADMATGFNTKSMLCKPVMSRKDKNILGVVQLLNKIKRTETHSYIIGTDSFTAEDEVVLDLFVSKLAKEIDEKYRALYFDESVMDAFVKPISDAAGKDNHHTPQYLKTTAVTENNHAFHLTREVEGRDMYAEHQSTILRTGVGGNKLSAEEDRDREVGNYLRMRHHGERHATGYGSG